MTQHENCHVEPLEKSFDPTWLENAMAAYLAVSGMGCPRCALRVQNGLLGLEGVLLAEVQLDYGVAVAAYDPTRVSPDHLLAAVAGAGNDGRHHYAATFLKQQPAREVFLS
ncbi:MAG: hypothetical protein Fur0022_01870 [Anaerolineales bacterium]